MLRKIISKAISFFVFRPFYALRMWWPVWFYGINAQSRRCYAAYKKTYSAVGERVLRDLRQDGIAAATLEDLFPGRDFMSEFLAYAKTLRPRAVPVPDKPFLLALWAYNNKDEAIDPANPFVKFALSDAVLDIVNGYLALCAKFFFYTLNVTLPVPPGSPPTKSQQWHRDPEDIKLCKVFLYLTDVDEDAGPFTYVRGSHYGGKWYHRFHPPLPMRTRPSDEEVRRIIPIKDITPFTGRAGTVLFCDTRGLHYGGYATQKERLMFTAEFSAQSAVAWIRYGYPPGFEEAKKKLSPFAQFAVDDRTGFAGALNKIFRFQQKHFPY